MNNRTLLFAWEAFEKSHPSGAGLVRSALLRFTLPGLGGEKPVGARLKSKEILSSLKLMESIYIDKEIAAKLKEAQIKTFKILDVSKKKTKATKMLSKYIYKLVRKRKYIFS
jgi:hypothetical protein